MVQIVSSGRILKQQGIHQISDIALLSKPYRGIVARTIESGSPFKGPIELSNQLSDLFLSLVILIGRFITFIAYNDIHIMCYLILALNALHDLLHEGCD